MKKAIALLLTCVLLGGCALVPPRTTMESMNATQHTVGTTPVEVTEPSEEVTETTVPETTLPPVYHNPLTGEEVPEEMTGRPYCVTINNLRDAIPHYGVEKADVFFESFVNGSIIRGLAMYMDPTDAPGIGSVRSTRFMFTDLALKYDAMVFHAGGSGMVLNDVAARNLDNFNIDTSSDTPYSFRDKENRKGYSLEHTLFAKGPGLPQKAQELGFRMERTSEDYGLHFTENVNLDGETAETITITILYKGGTKKDSVMTYDPETGKYNYNQYGKQMFDGQTGNPEQFKNVFVLEAPITCNQWNYQRADFSGGGTGHYACEGKIIPILWQSDGENVPLTFTLEDGTPLEQGIGNSYIAITQLDSPLKWE